MTQFHPRPITHLLYLHGFRSSPQSTKARLVAQHMATHQPQVTWWCPQLPPSPHAACELLQQGTKNWPHDSMAVMGSSLGGFYATWVAEQTGCKAVLLNPAVDPARDLAKYIGEQTCWQEPQETFFFEPGFIDELRTLTCTAITRPERYLALIAKGDELLDWREANARYAGAQIRLLEGGDHAISDFEAHLPALLAFLGLD
jgi:predicted esterase YcpF (UPF0227 family)